jgi:hypothetical protein
MKSLPVPPTVPTSITRAQVVEALAALGLVADQCSKLKLEPRGVTVEVYDPTRRGLVTYWMPVVA